MIPATVDKNLPDTREGRKAGILDLQDALQGTPEEYQVQLPVFHYFANGVYGREIFIPEGVCVVGKIHLHECINVLTEGRVRVVTEFGSDEFAAPVTFISPAGAKRAVYALEDCTWTTFHPSIDDDVDKTVQALVTNDYNDQRLLGVL